VIRLGSTVIINIWFSYYLNMESDFQDLTVFATGIFLFIVSTSYNVHKRPYLNVQGYAGYTCLLTNKQDSENLP